MKRAIVLAILAVTLTFGTSSAYAFPNGPCISRPDQSAASELTQTQLFMLLLPVVVNAVA